MHSFYFLPQEAVVSPIGAFKTKANLTQEVIVLKELIMQTHSIKKVVLSVPFAHIYGVLASLLLPLHLGDITLIVKDDFLPYELLEEAADEETLIITTPVFIKALARIQAPHNLHKTLFISSIAPLAFEDIERFQNTYNTNIIQLFGSTETGGIAYKHNLDTQWSPLEGVQSAVVDLVYKKELLRSEQLRITLQSQKQIEKKEIKTKISKNYGVLTIPFQVVYVEKINRSVMGKKILF